MGAEKNGCSNETQALSCNFYGRDFSACACSTRPGSSGGGDADAVQFIIRAADVGSWMKNQPAKFSKDETDRYDATLKQLVYKMNGGVSAPIRFVNDTDVKVDGVSKMAAFDKSENTITVSRPSWNLLDIEKQYQLAALEIFGLSNISKRYLKSGFIQDSLKISLKERLSHSVLPQTVKTFHDDCADKYVVGVNASSPRCTKITYSDDAVTVTTVCAAGNKTLIATVSSPYIRIGEFAHALSRPKDEVVFGEYSCIAKIEDFPDQTGFFMTSISRDQTNQTMVDYSGNALFW